MKHPLTHFTGLHPACLLALLAFANSARADEFIFWDGFESPDSCPAGRILTSGILYYAADGRPTVHGVDVTQWDSIWGRSEPSDAIVSWPGSRSSSIVFTNFTRTGYVAAHFTVPAGVNYAGLMTHGSYYAGANLDATVSTHCGDFTHVEAACVRENTAGGDTLVPWRTQIAGGCQLPAGDYYLNLRLTDPTQTASGCNSVECEESVQDVWNPY